DDGGGQRGVAARRGGRRPGVGELPLVGFVRVAVEHRDADPGGLLRARPSPEALGQRRPDGRLLLRHRAGGAPRAFDRRADQAAAKRAARGRGARLVGMVVHVASSLLLTPSGDEALGWGIVIGTDTAFLLGALALVGPRCPTQLRVFLLTLTVFDDAVAVAVIGLAYSDALDLPL